MGRDFEIVDVDAHLARAFPDFREAAPITAGRPGPHTGALSFAALKLACDFALEHGCSGLVTLPLSKEWVAKSLRPDFRGHTEYLAERFQSNVLMLMHGREFSVVPITVHIAVDEVPAALRQRLAEPAFLELLQQLQRLPEYGGARWAMCGLNPHCGDGGTIGREELDFLNDFCEDLRQRGFPLEGPKPADTLFMESVRRRYRLIFSCYHDQGLIPFKAFEGAYGVNATIGLPIVRTSPDHGTAFDLAASRASKPDAGSLRAAIRAALSGELTAT